MKKWLVFIISIIIINYSICCTKEAKPIVQRKIISTDSILTFKSDSLRKVQESLTFSFYKISKKDTKTKLLKKIGEKNLENILAINRIDKMTNSTLVVPDSIYTDFNIYAPFPLSIERIKDVKKIILVSQRVQAFAAYENGILIFWGPISSGKESTPTPNGLFHTNWKAKKQISTDNPAWILNWNFNLMNHKGVSLHQFSLPGYPASHACVRLLERDAYRIYNWADQWILTPDGKLIKYYGTPTIIFGKYTTPKIWKFLPTKKEDAYISNEELDTQLNEFLDTIHKRQNDRVANTKSIK